MPDFDITPIVSLGGCQLYRPGHAAHFIQARVCWTVERGVHEVELEEIGSDVITVGDGDRVLRLLHHDTEQIAGIVNGLFEGVFLGSRNTLLTIGLRGGYLTFSVKPDDGTSLEQCSDGVWN